MKLCMGCMNQMEDRMSVCPHCGFNEAELKQEAYYLTPGTVVGGKYIVGRALSYRGYTVTYLGMDAEKNRKVIVKEYLPNEFSTRSEGDTDVTIYSGDAEIQFEQGLTTFLNEANRIQQLGKPQGIMQVYDCVAENDTGYVISEYLEGKTLAQMLEAGKRFSPQEAKEFICEILEGLRKVHPLDVIHCDIAPETIFVTNTGEIKLLDFGATRYVTTANSKSLAIILKQGYAPEEQYRSGGFRGPWTDVYALGAVMYHMITGVVPVESVDRALVDELKEPSKLGIQIPQNMENALMNALNVYQKDRTPSAEVFYQELNSVQVKRIQVKKQKYETGKFPTWAKVLVAGVLCIVVAGGTILIIKQNQNKSEVAETGSNVILAQPVLGMTEAEAKEILESSGEGVIFEADKVFFEKGIEGGSKILTQEPAAGRDVDPEDKKITGTVRSSEKCMYIDVLEQENNVDVLVEELGIDRSKLAASAESDAADQKKSFKNLYEVILNDGTRLKPADLEVGKDSRVLNLSEIQSVTYYVSPYIYKKKLGNYDGKNIKDISFDKYTEKNGKKKKIKGGASPAYSARYFSFDKKEGYIVEQKKAKGKSYNSYKDMGELFVTVKEQIAYDKTDADGLIKRLKNKGFRVAEKGSGTEIADIRVGGKGGTVYFTQKDEIMITRREKAKAVPSAKPRGRREKSSGGLKSATEGGANFD